VTARWRLLFISPFLIAGVLLMVWYGVWRAGAAAMRAALGDFAADEAADGGAVTHAPMRARGFPFFLRGEADDFSIARGKYRLDAETIYLHASPFDLRRIVFSASPLIRLQTPSDVWTIRTEGARASIEAAEGRWLFKAEAARLDGAGGETRVKTGRGVINVAPDAAGAYKVSFRILGAELKNTRGETSIARLDATLTAANEPPRLTIHALDGEIGQARLGLSGGFARDGEGFAAGRLDASIENPAALMEALAVLGAVKPDKARTIEAGLALLGAAGGGRIAAPVEFANGETKLAGVRIASAPRLGQP
jgi:hypothetical protein